MNEGYSVFVNQNKKYLGLLDILVESILSFSTRPVEIFSINFDYKHSSEKVFSKRINLPYENYETICYSKILSSINSRFSYGIQLDADFIITKEMDNLFDLTKNIKEFPKYCLHPHDPDNQKNLMSYLGVPEKTQPYVHATYLFSDSSKPFLEDCYATSKDLLIKGISPPNLDETLMNVMLWKAGDTDAFIDPYDLWFEYFLSERFKEKNVNFYSLHGCKDIDKALDILNGLKNDNSLYEN
jgi:hypothetical protein